MLLGSDGTLRLMPGLVRIPDVSFISWDRLPTRQHPTVAIPDLVPDLAVEVVSVGNTKAEMKRKVREYLDAGCRIIWLVDPRKRIVEVITVAGRRSSTRWARSTVATCYRALNSQSAIFSPRCRSEALSSERIGRQFPKAWCDKIPFLATNNPGRSLLSGDEVR